MKVFSPHTMIAVCSFRLTISKCASVRQFYLAHTPSLYRRVVHQEPLTSIGFPISGQYRFTLLLAHSTPSFSYSVVYCRRDDWKGFLFEAEMLQLPPQFVQSVASAHFASPSLQRHFSIALAPVVAASATQRENESDSASKSENSTGLGPGSDLFDLISYAEKADVRIL